MKPEELKLKVVKVVEKQFDKLCKETCNEAYYKNEYLKYAMENHNSLQCIARTYAEALHTGVEFSHDKSDLYHANQILTYLQNYQDTSKLDYIAALLSNFLQELPKSEDYIIMSCYGREKSLRSVEAKTRYKILMCKAIRYVKNNFDSVEDFKVFSKEEISIAKNCLDSLLTEITKKSPTKDIFGVRFIVDKIGKSTCTETEVIHYCYILRENLIDFFAENGIELLEEKDYIKEPKNSTNYQSIHLIFEVFGMPIEIQIRTSQMHYVAEYGSASHEKVYKDTVLQNFTRDFLNILSEQTNKLVSNEQNCLLKSFNFFEKHISKTPNGEVPTTPLDLDCSDNETFCNFLANVHSTKKTH